MESERIKRLEIAKKISTEKSFRSHGYDKLLKELKTSDNAGVELPSKLDIAKANGYISNNAGGINSK